MSTAVVEIEKIENDGICYTGEFMSINGIITGYSGNKLTVKVAADDMNDIIKKRKTGVRLLLDDGKRITADQRKKLYATFNDISKYTGHGSGYIKEFMKNDFIEATGCEAFSLSDIDMTTAQEFLEHTIEFCMEHGIPTQDSLLERAPDIVRYVYMCAMNKKCCVTGRHAKLYLLSSEGERQRGKGIISAGDSVIPLCDMLLNELHAIGKQSFCEKYHVCGVIADSKICKVYDLPF